MTEMLQTAILTPEELSLVDNWQRGFPLVARPYAHIGARGGMTEERVLEMLAHLAQLGVLSRVGATLRPNTAGASMLAAMQVPPQRLEEVAEIVNREPSVNHNYEREHAINLWFVVTAADRAALTAALGRIRAASGLDVLELPLERSYHIDLGFPLTATEITRGGGWKTAASRIAYCPAAAWTLDRTDHLLLELLTDGLALVPQPFAPLAEAAAIAEDEALARISRLVAIGVITRLGLIVRHRPLGYRANAMAVWDIADADVDAIGGQLAAQPFVTLCYRRPRRLPGWRYNLFCMVHGRDRVTTAAQVGELSRRAGSSIRAHAVLFSRRCFRQRGARLTSG